MLLVLVLVGGVAALAPIASGCGSSDSEEALTKKQFVHRTQAYCNRGYHKQERAMERYGRAHNLVFGGGEPWEQELINDAVVLDYVRKRIAFWKSLPPPEGDEKQISQIIEAMEKGLETVEEDPATLAEPRPGRKPLPEPFERNRILTANYGPYLCGQA